MQSLEIDGLKEVIQTLETTPEVIPAGSGRVL